MVSITWRIFLVVQKQVNKLRHLKIINCDYWLMVVGNNEVKLIRWYTS